MKKIYLFALCLLTLPAFSQMVDFDGETNVYTGTLTNVDDEEMHIGWSVLNISSETIDLRLRREVVQNTPGATNQFCWGEICSAFGTTNLTSGEIVTLAPGTSTETFYSKYRHNGNAGQSIYRFCWFDNANPANEVCYEVNFCIDAACIVNVEESIQDGSIGNITPNPIQTTGFISYSFTSKPQAGKMKIYNALGAMVKEVDLSSREGAVVISANDFENGLYFCRIEDAGRVLETQRLIISR